MAARFIASALATSSLLVGSGLAQVPNNAGGTYPLRQANASYGPALEEVHYYEKYWPIGIAISSTGRGFASYTRGTYDYTVGVFTNRTAEAAFPSRGPVLNARADELNTSFNGIPFGPSTPALVSVQALYITPSTPSRPETLWLLDTGRPSIPSGSGGKTVMPYAQPGGPKLVAVNITAGNDTAYRSYTFPADVHYPDSYLNDLRFDLRSNLSHTHGGGVAYLVDSSDEGRPGFIVLDLKTGASHRRLTQHPSVLRTPGAVPSYLQQPFYYRAPASQVSTLREGLDGFSLSPDGRRAFYSPLTSNDLYSIPTENLRAPAADPLSELAAAANVSTHGQRGGEANGFESDSQGRIYQLIPSQNAVYFYNQTTYQTEGFLADPRILWPDGASVGADGYIYLNINQLYFQGAWNDGVDGRRFPGVVLRAKLPEGAGKIDLQD